MAQKPDGKPAKLQRVQFTRPAAERIAKVVRKVEEGDRRAEPLRFGPRLRSIGGATTAVAGSFRVATFTTHWNVGQTAEITFANPIYSSATATAINLFCSIADGRVGVLQDETNVWHLVSWEMKEVCRTQVINVQVSLNTETCEITKTLATTTQKFLQLTYPFATCSTATTP